MYVNNPAQRNLGVCDARRSLTQLINLAININPLLSDYAEVYSTFNYPSTNLQHLRFAMLKHRI